MMYGVEMSSSGNLFLPSFMKRFPGAQATISFCHEILMAVLLVLWHAVS
jgi:hypothetical protein